MSKKKCGTITYEVETDRYEEDPWKCYEKLTNFMSDLDHTGILDLLKDIKAVAVTEADCAYEGGGLYHVADCGFTLLGKKDGKYYLIDIDESEVWNTRATAIEVCNEYGCHFVPACHTGYERGEIKVCVEEVPKQVWEKFAREAIELDEQITAYDYIKEYLTGAKDEQLEQLRERIEKILLPN